MSARLLPLLVVIAIVVPAGADVVVGPSEPVRIIPPEVLVEGHVFNRRNQRPLPYAIVTPLSGAVLRDGEIEPTRRGRHAFTDDNGFYSMIVDIEEFRFLEAVCSLGVRDAETVLKSSRTALPFAEVPVVRRDLYIDVGRRNPQNCSRDLYFTQ